MSLDLRQRARELVRASLFLDAHAPVAHACDAGEEAVLVMGTFDGLHRGHRALIASAVADARRRGLPCKPLTFQPDPAVLFQGAKAPSQLLGWPGRMRGLRALGADEPLVLDFTRELAATEPDAFVSELLMRIVRPRAVHVGSNFRFGRGAAGDVEQLRALGRAHGFAVCEHELLACDGARVSSTRIRTLLAQEGGLDQANELLARCHYVDGSVIHGRGEGGSFGFATANVRCPELSCLPHPGVYAGFVVEGLSCWPAAINVGCAPSFSSGGELFLEAHLLGYDGDLYGREVSVCFARWLRASRPFSSLDELKRVVNADIDWTREHLGEGEVSLA